MLKNSSNLIPNKKHGKKLYFIRTEIEKWILDGEVKTSYEIDALAMDYIISKPSK